nr:hypothetical protein [Tanacetum cinerariifolium]
MSSASSAVTYTSIYTDSELGRVFWGADEELSDGGSPRVIVYVYDGLPMQLVAPPSPDYIPGPKEPQTPPVPQDEDEQDGPVDYPMDGGDDGDDDDGDSYEDDADNEDEDEDEEEEDVEHLALADFVVVIPPVELVSPPEGTDPAEVERLLAMPTPPPSPLTSLSPPFVKERLARCTAPSAHSSPSPVPSLLPPSSRCPTQIQTLRMASTQALIDAVTAALPSPPLPPLPPPLYIPPLVNRRDDIPETEMPPRKSTLDAEARRRGIGEVRVTKLVELHEHDTRDLYALLEDAQDCRTHISLRVTIDSLRVNLLMEDRIAYQETILIMEEEAYAA